MIDKRNKDFIGFELVELTPVIFGGSSTDKNNKVYLNRKQHFEFVRFWNNKLAQQLSLN